MLRVAGCDADFYPLLLHFNDVAQSFLAEMGHHFHALDVIWCDTNILNLLLQSYKQDSYHNRIYDILQSSDELFVG